MTVHSNAYHLPLMNVRATRHYRSNPHRRQVLLHLRVRSHSPLSCSFKSPRSRYVYPLQTRMRVYKMSSGSPLRATLPSFLLNAPAELETAWSSNGENTMNLDETPRSSTRLCSHDQRFQCGACEQTKTHTSDNTVPPLVHSGPCSSMPNVLSPRLALPPVTATGYLQTPDPVTIPTPLIGSAILPPHSPFSSGCVNTMLLYLRESQPSQQQQAPPRRSRFTMGPRPDCEKCRLGVPGHYAHFD
ncbi:hypothetical protein EDB87DRAFT_427713 [Lactarius vividus]|nr:hypothetical protein EDB87DRAFT_427713 [Lactarius vividus]